MAGSPLQMLSIEFDAASKARIARMISAAPTFLGFYESAMKASVAKAIGYAIDHTNDFRNPTGKLRGGIRGYVDSPMKGVIGVIAQVPYAARREFGFSGQTDSLGRFYPNDPGILYLTRAADEVSPFVAEAFAAATLFAIRTL